MSGILTPINNQKEALFGSADRNYADDEPELRSRDLLYPALDRLGEVTEWSEVYAFKSNGEWVSPDDTEQLLEETISTSTQNGFNLGSFVLRPALRFETEFTDRRIRGRSSINYAVEPKLDIQSLWIQDSARLLLSSRHVLDNLNLSSIKTDALVDGSVNLKIGTHATLSFDSSLSYRQDGRIPSTILFDNDQDADETKFRAGVSVKQQYNRLSLSARGDFVANEIGQLSFIENDPQRIDDLDYSEMRGTVQIGYAALSAVRPFVEGSYSMVRHAKETDVNGFRKDSDAVSFGAGIEILTGSENDADLTSDFFLKARLAVGYTEREYEDPRLKSAKGITVDANVAWSPTDLTTFGLIATTQISETAFAGASAAFERSLSAEVAHTFSNTTIGQLTAFYTNTNLVGEDITQDSFGVSVGLVHSRNCD